jgi:hypothetical protein
MLPLLEEIQLSELSTNYSYALIPNMIKLVIHHHHHQYSSAAGVATMETYSCVSLALAP